MMLTKIKLFLLNRYKQTTKSSSRREYSSGTLAEYWCTWSNIGFFFVGILFGDIPLILAGIFSLFSHAVPSQLVHDLDMLGVGLIGIKILLSLPLLISNPIMLPFVLGFGGLAVVINILDAFITPKYYEQVGPWLHVAWHLSAAMAMFIVNMALIGNPFVLIPGILIVLAGLVSLKFTAILTEAAKIWNVSYQQLQADLVTQPQNDLLSQPSSTLQNTDPTVSMVSFSLLGALHPNFNRQALIPSSLDANPSVNDQSTNKSQCLC